MKIVQLAPLYQPITKSMQYGGVERVVLSLANEIAQTEEVTLIAMSGSKVGNVNLIFCEKGDYETQAKYLLKLIEVGECDVVHVHRRSMFETRLAKQIIATGVPIVSTIHGPVENVIPHYKDLVYSWSSSVHYVAVSKFQLESLSHFFGPAMVGFVRNGVNHSGRYQICTQNIHPSGCLFLGRLSKVKGVHNAIAVAKATGVPLVIAGVVHDEDIGYFVTEVEPSIDGKLIQFIGPVNDDEKTELFRSSKCLLAPVEWDDPCPLTVLESMSWGCPVVAYNRGAMSELITDGVSGFIVKDKHELEEAVMSRVHLLDRKTVELVTSQRFTWKESTQQYLDIYKNLITSYK